MYSGRDKRLGNYCSILSASERNEPHTKIKETYNKTHKNLESISRRKRILLKRNIKKEN